MNHKATKAAYRHLLWSYKRHGTVTKCLHRAFKEWLNYTLSFLRTAFSLSPNLNLGRKPSKTESTSFRGTYLSHFTSTLHTVLYIKIAKQTWAICLLPSWVRKISYYHLFIQKAALHKAFSPSPHRRWTSFILSADLQIPLQLQSNEATQTLPAWAFHSQSVW